MEHRQNPEANNGVKQVFCERIKLIASFVHDVARIPRRVTPIYKVYGIWPVTRVWFASC